MNVAQPWGNLTEDENLLVGQWVKRFNVQRVELRVPMLEPHPEGGPMTMHNKIVAYARGRDGVEFWAPFAASQMTVADMLMMLGTGLDRKRIS